MSRKSLWYEEEQPNYLSEKEIFSTTGITKSQRFGVGFAHTPGRKVDSDGKHVMEDILFIECGFRGRPNEDLFIVLDGHNGLEAAKMVGKRFETILKKKMDEIEDMEVDKVHSLEESMDIEVEPKDLSINQKRVVCALHSAFDDVRAELKAHLLKLQDEAGTTALVCLIIDNDLYVTNVGDTRAVLVDYDGKAEQLSVDHRPIFEEKDRIEASGGTVTSISIPRVEGVLAVSRALGNFDLEEKGIIGKPHTRVTPSFLNDSWFLILATDGLWDSVSMQVAAELVDDVLYVSASEKKERNDEEDAFFPDSDMEFQKKTKYRDNKKEMEACKELVKAAWSKKTLDNIGIILINFG